MKLVVKIKELQFYDVESVLLGNAVFVSVRIGPYRCFSREKVVLETKLRKYSFFGEVVSVSFDPNLIKCDSCLIETFLKSNLGIQTWASFHIPITIPFPSCEVYDTMEYLDVVINENRLFGLIDMYIIPDSFDFAVFDSLTDEIMSSSKLSSSNGECRVEALECRLKEECSRNKSCRKFLQAFVSSNIQCDVMLKQVLNETRNDYTSLCQEYVDLACIVKRKSDHEGILLQQIKITEEVILNLNDKIEELSSRISFLTSQIEEKNEELRDVLSELIECKLKCAEQAEKLDMERKTFTHL